jgi:nitrite reductase/ring-hydroxylating ferredoxin subunit
MIGVSDAVPSAALPLGNTSPVWHRAWHPVAPAAEVTADAPAQVLVAGEAWVLARLDGRLVAFEDQCPHRLSPLSAGDVTRAADGTARLTCAYHGWRFDAAGRCDLMPAHGLRERWLGERRRRENAGRRTALRAAHGVIEAYGLIWLAPREPLAPLPAFPEWDAPGVTSTSATSVRTSASAGQLVGGFLDAAQLLGAGTASPLQVTDEVTGGVTAAVTADAWQVTGVFTGPGATAARSAMAATPRLTKTAGVSGTAHARLELPDATIGILLGCQPEDWTTTRVFTLIACGDGGGGGAGAGAGGGASGGRLAGSFVMPEGEVPAGEATEPGTMSTAWHRLMARAAATVTG